VPLKRHTQYMLWHTDKK